MSPIKEKAKLPGNIKVFDCNGNSSFDSNGNGKFDCNGNGKFDIQGNGNIK